LEWLVAVEPLARLGIIPEEIPGRVPISVLRDFEKCVSGHASCNQDIVECQISSYISLVHTTIHVRLQPNASIEQFQNIVHTDDHIVEVDHSRLRLIRIVPDQWEQR
jgi:hypothetical protein